MKLVSSLVILIAVCAPPLYSQAPATAAPAPAPSTDLPTAPAAIAYRYWPRQIVQWVGPELPYSMIEVMIDDRTPQPLYDAVLTERATNKRVHYTNQAAEAALDQAMGAEAHLVPIQFDAPAQPTNGSTYLLRFATEKNIPVQWQFVQGSDITEQGSGVTPVEGPAPSLLYREQGAVAGEGTALKVGNTTSTADIWQEISHAPYFVAYRGALSQDVHVIAFLPRTITWKIQPANANVAPAAAWTQTGTSGNSVTTHVETLTNGTATLQQTNHALGVTASLEARQTPAGWALERVRYTPQGGNAEHSVTFTFSPGLQDAGISKFEVIAGRKTHLGNGTVTAGAGGKEAWTLLKPNLMAKAPVEASATQTR